VEEEGSYDWSGLISGARAAFGIAGLVMSASFVGFGAFLQSINFDLWIGLLSVPIVWALPGQVVFVDSIHKGMGLAAIAFAVSLTAVRLMPMAVLVLSRSRLPGQSRWPELLVAHFTAVTLWMIANRGLELLPARRRLPWLIGLGSTLMIGMMGFVLLGYALAGQMPPLLAACLVFLTPAFFLISLFAGGKWRSDYLAILFGLILGPTTYYFAPELDLLVAGLLGGTLAHIAGRFAR
jgi:predicted branched-subunit amino acid permease